MNFVTITLALTVALVVSGIILTAIGFALTMNPKFQKWVIENYTKSLNAMDDISE